MRLSRRAALGLVPAAGAGWLLAGAAPAHGQVHQPRIRPRADWAGDLAPTGTLTVEQPEDVRFVLIHHSASPNTDRPEATPERIRSFFHHHTGTKGWPDVAYNFFVDRFGVIWEGRRGSLHQPVRGDATGGSQGFGLLCCFIGDHTTEPPTAVAMTSMAALVAWLAGRYRIDLWRGHDITFTSRGSNKHPSGRTVTTGPLAAHRDMSQTSCPGDALYPLVQTELLTRARIHTRISTGLAVGLP